MTFLSGLASLREIRAVRRVSRQAAKKRKAIHGSYPLMFGAKSLADLKQPEFAEQVKDASPMELVSSDDPPTYLNYPTPLGGTPLPEETSVMWSIHHAEFGAMIKEKLDAAGVENVLQVVGDGKPKEAKLEFLKQHLQPEAK